MDSFDSSRAWTSVAVWYLYALHPPVRKHTCNQVFNAARVCAAPSVIIARFRGGKNDNRLTGSKGLVFRRLFISLNGYACVNMLWTFCCCVEIFFFLSEKKGRRLFGLRLLFRFIIFLLFRLEDEEVILFYDN